MRIITNPHGFANGYPNGRIVTEPSGRRVFCLFINKSRATRDLSNISTLKGHMNLDYEIHYSDGSYVTGQMNRCPDNTFNVSTYVPHLLGVNNPTKPKTNLQNWSRKRNWHKKRLIRVYYQIKNLMSEEKLLYYTPSQIQELDSIEKSMQAFIDTYRDQYKEAKALHCN